MNVTVKLTNAGAIEKAMLRVNAAKEELYAAAAELAIACGQERVEMIEAADAVNASSPRTTK